MRSSFSWFFSNQIGDNTNGHFRKCSV
jgi:hypothetical protein